MPAAIGGALLFHLTPSGTVSVTAPPHTTAQLYSLPLACQSVSANVSVRLFPGVIVTNLSALSATDESVVDPLVFTPI